MTTSPAVPPAARHPEDHGHGDEHPSPIAQRQFWNSWNSKYREESLLLPDVNRRQATKALEWVSDLGRSDLSILEVGCGTGWLCERLTPFGEVVGIDLSDEVIERSKKRLEAVSLIAGDFMEMDLPPARFDIVVSLEVLAHVADQGAFVSRVHRVLRPGGLMVIATQNRFTLSRWSAVSPQGVGQVRRWVDASELKALLRSQFDLVQLVSMVPVGDRGMLRLVNHPRLNRWLTLVVPQWRLDGFKERCLLGHTLMALARKPVEGLVR